MRGHLDTRHARGVQVKIGISFVSVDGARRNLDAEQHGFNFGKVLGGARGAWNRALGSWRNSAPLPYFSTRTTPRVAPTLKPSAARLSMAVLSKRSSTFHMIRSG